MDNVSYVFAVVDFVHCLELNFIFQFVISFFVVFFVVTVEKNFCGIWWNILIILSNKLRGHTGRLVLASLIQYNQRGSSIKVSRDGRGYQYWSEAFSDFIGSRCKRGKCNQN